MGKYLHSFKSFQDLQNCYDGSGYTEPWVSYTEDEISGLTTSFVIIDYFPETSSWGESQYALDELYASPIRGMDSNGSIQPFYARYKPVTDASWPMAYTSIPPTEDLCSIENVVFLNKEENGYMTFNNPGESLVWSCSTETIAINKVNYNKKQYRVVATIDNWDPSQTDVQMTILEDNIMHFPFLPDFDENDNYRVKNVSYSFTVNGVTYEGSGEMTMRPENDYRSMTVSFGEGQNQVTFAYVFGVDGLSGYDPEVYIGGYGEN